MSKNARSFVTAVCRVSALTLLLTPGFAAAQDEDLEKALSGGNYSCVINTSGVDNCDYFNVSVGYTGGSTRTAVLDLNASFLWTTAIVRVETCNATGWSFHLGDSPSNNGGGGDGAQTRHDAEVQAFNTTLTAYRSDFNIGAECSAVGPTNPTGCVIQQYLVRNDFLQFDPNVNTFGDPITTCSDVYLFDFPAYDEADNEDPAGNYADFLYLGLNRTYGSAARSGSGITKACVFLSTSATPAAATIAAECGF